MYHSLETSLKLVLFKINCCPEQDHNYHFTRTNLFVFLLQLGLVSFIEQIFQASFREHSSSICSPDGAMSGGVGLESWSTGKLGPAWVGAWHGAWEVVVGGLGVHK